MTPDEINNVYNSLAATLPARAEAVTQQIGQAEAQKGAALATVASTGGGVGAYNQARLITPVVNTLSDSLVTQGRQLAFKAGAEQIIADATLAYNDARDAYSKRQAAKRAAAAAAAIAAATPAATPGSTINGIKFNSNNIQSPANGNIQGSSPNLQGQPVILQGGSNPQQTSTIPLQGGKGIRIQ